MEAWINGSDLRLQTIISGPLISPCLLHSFFSLVEQFISRLFEMFQKTRRDNPATYLSSRCQNYLEGELALEDKIFMLKRKTFAWHMAEKGGRKEEGKQIFCIRLSPILLGRIVDKNQMDISKRFMPILLNILPILQKEEQQEEDGKIQ